MLSQLKKNKVLKIIFNIFLFFIFSSQLLASNKELNIKIQNNPIESSFFWLEKNNFGRNINKLNFSVDLAINKGRIEYFTSIYSGLNDINQKNIYINEIYVKYDISESIFLRTGKYYRDFSNYLNDNLSSGSMLISNNARAIPKVGIVGSQNINTNLMIDFGISHSFLNKSKNYIKAPYLHEKFVYLKFANSHYEFGAGFVHEAIWAGSTISDGRQPSSIKDFLKVFIAADEPLRDNQPHENAIGNHLGIWDFYFIKKNEDKLIKFYHQHFFEDSSGLRFDNKWDGLWGFEIFSEKFDTNLLVEYLDTSNQNIDPPYVEDAYYNHWIYIDGWSYKGNTIGNPFIKSSEVNPSQVLYFGLKSKISEKLILKSIFSKNIDKASELSYSVETLYSINQNFSLNLFFVNNLQNQTSLGFGLNWML